MIPVQASAKVLASQPRGAYHVLELEHRGIASGARPGQFVNLAVDPCNGFLRLPFSVAWSDAERGTLAVVFDPIGDGTRWLAARTPGDQVDLAGPLGHGYEIGKPSGADLLVGGGYGAAALVGLAEALAERGRSVVAILGARSKQRLLIDPRMQEACRPLLTVTEDGSEGASGRVTDVMQSAIEEHGVSTIYACGPNPMLAAVAAEGRRLQVSTQLAVEEFMACGIGVCWTCVVPISTPEGIRHQRACTEGPVFTGEELAWA